MKIAQPEKVNLLCLRGRVMAVKAGSFHLTNEWLAGTCVPGFVAVEEDGKTIAGPIDVLDYVRVSA